jgi:cytochrome c2
MRGHACKLIIVCCISVSCESINYVPPVTPQMAASNSRRQDVDLRNLREGRTLFVHRCIECHTLPPLWHYTSKDWIEIVNSMSHRASLKPAERDAVIAYILAVRATER